MVVIKIMNSLDNESSLKWDATWLQFSSRETPSSTMLHPDFLSELHGGSLLLDVGCGFGKKTATLLNYGSVVGVDINLNELKEARSANGDSPRTSYCLASGALLPYEEHQFDVAVLLGTLGATDRVTRVHIIADTVRCLKSGGLIYISEFLRIDNERQWQEIYLRDEIITKEYGSFLPRARNGRQFMAHHFDQQELTTLLAVNGISNFRVKEAEVLSTTSVQSNYRTICLWGEIS